MQYRINPKNGDRLSQLGLGCMRFPRKGRLPDQGKVDELVATAIEMGINYFDTAYIYPGSEEALGKALAGAGKREQVYIATKLPHYMCKKPEDFDRMFNTQLERLRTDRVDYYMMHMLSNKESWERLKALDMEQWIEKKRGEGQIRNLGFSFHGGREAFLRLLDAYDWDFCMIQYNYYDKNDQASTVGVKAAHDKGIPVFTMEPLRGGLLATGLPDSAIRAFRSVDNDRSPVEWALRWLYDQPEITMALSGMSDITQLTENSAIAENAGPGIITDAEHSAYETAVEALNRSAGIPCTACGYCMPCPRGVDIPACFSCYNVSKTLSRTRGIMQYMQVTGQWTPARSDASKCVECGVCITRCPQSIQIPKELKNVRRRLISFILVPLTGLLRRIWRIGKQY